MRFDMIDTSYRTAEQDALTEKELEIVPLLGLKTSEIALKTGLHIRAVEKRIDLILEKTELSNRTSVLVTALKKGWIDLDEIPVSKKEY